MKLFVVFLFMALFAIAAAQPLIIKKLADRIKEKLDDPDHEPLTLVGRAAKKAHEKLNDPDYEPITLQGKLIKKTYEALTDADKEPVLLGTKIIKKIINKDDEKDSKKSE